MQRSMKILLALLFFVFVMGVTISILSYILINKSLPDYGAEISLPQLEAPVEVRRDEFAVPHIFAKTDLDAFRVLGFVHAQERLWQMDFFRRAGAGRLSEIFGAPALESDKLMRTWGFAANTSWLADSISIESKAVLVAYAQGVNRFIELNSSRLPIEFSLLGYKPEAWKPRDALIIQRLLAMRLSIAWHVELTFYRIAAEFGAKAAREIFPDYPPVSQKAIERPANQAANFAAIQNSMQAAGRYTGWGTGFAASNSWVVAGEKSRSGKPLLANDPHLELSAPGFWFELHISSPSYNVAGMSIPGIPGIVIGHNSSIAWGFTNSMVDDIDFYFEKIKPETPDYYRDKNQWRKFKYRTEKIVVKDRLDPVFLDVRETARGPVISAVHPGWPMDSLVISLRWTGAGFSDDLRAILLLNRAKNPDEFFAALQHYGAPCQNVTYADRDGNIGFQMAGKIPLRRDKQGHLPYLAWENKGDWLGDLPLKKMPHRWNPNNYFVVTANNAGLADGFSGYFSNAWEPESRARQITRLLQQKEKLTVADFQKMQLDELSLYAVELIHRFKKQIDIFALNDREKQIWQLLLEWKGEMHQFSAGATIFHHLLVNLLQETFSDQLQPAVYQEFMRWTTIPARALENLVQNPGSVWWDDRQTAGREKMGDMLHRAFTKTCAQLLENYGDGPGFWEWGRIHRFTLRHPLGKIPPFDYIFDRGEYNIGGAAGSIHKAEYRFTAPFAVDVGASMRQIVDLAQPDRAFTIIPGGQSGQPFSDHYDDQIAMWRNGELKSVSTGQDSADGVFATVQYFRQK